jgi:flagellar hook protein FlgE
MSSLLTSASGLDSLQTGLDVISNNIANVNTVGYRGNQTQFQDLLYNTQQVATSTIPVNTAVGSGTGVVATVTQFQQGALQATGNATDVGIEGDGFFVTTGALTETPTNYTRAGQFVVDNNRYLRAQDGSYVTGSGQFALVAGSKSFPAPTGPINNLSVVQIPQALADGEQVTNYSIGTNGAINVTGSGGSTQVIGYLALATFRDNTGLQQTAGTNFNATPASGPATYYSPGQGTAGLTQGGAIENSNVNLTTQFSNMIITQQAFDACARGLTVSNEVLQTAIGLKR